MLDGIVEHVKKKEPKFLDAAAEQFEWMDEEVLALLT